MSLLSRLMGINKREEGDSCATRSCYANYCNWKEMKVTWFQFADYGKELRLGVKPFRNGCRGLCSNSCAPEKRPRSIGRCNPAPGIGYSITRVHIIPGSARDGKPHSFLLCFMLFPDGGRQNFEVVRPPQLERSAALA